MSAVGSAVRRREDSRLVTGRGRFVADIAPEAFEVALVRSTEAHARILGVEVEKAKAAPGVMSVYTGEDLRGRVSPLSHERMPHLNQSEWYPLALDQVRHFGEPIV